MDQPTCTVRFDAKRQAAPGAAQAMAAGEGPVGRPVHALGTWVCLTL